MARSGGTTRPVLRLPSTEDFSGDLWRIDQRTHAESTSDDEDYDNNPLWFTRPDASNTRSAVGTDSDHPLPVILNDPEGGSQKVKATEDLTWFFETDPADGSRTCWVCWYVIFCSIHCLFSDRVCNSTTWAAGKVAPAGVYKKSTGGGNLRAHINKNHGALYLEQVSSRNEWTSFLLRQGLIPIQLIMFPPDHLIMTTSPLQSCIVPWSILSWQTIRYEIPDKFYYFT